MGKEVVQVCTVSPREYPQHEAKPRVGVETKSHLSRGIEL